MNNRDTTSTRTSHVHRPSVLLPESWPAKFAGIHLRRPQAMHLASADGSLQSVVLRYAQYTRGT
jgi:hypothetical protein